MGTDIHMYFDYTEDNGKTFIDHPLFFYIDSGLDDAIDNKISAKSSDMKVLYPKKTTDEISKILEDYYNTKSIPELLEITRSYGYTEQYYRFRFTKKFGPNIEIDFDHDNKKYLENLIETLSFDEDRIQKFCKECWELSRPYRSRDYNLFSYLSHIRGSTQQSSILHQELPTNICYNIFKIKERWGNDFHSPGWIMLDDLLNTEELTSFSNIKILKKMFSKNVDLISKTRIICFYDN